MFPATTVVENLQDLRKRFRLSQSALARLSGVSRFKICMYELGDGGLTTDEQNRIHAALQAEAERLRNIPIPIEFGRGQHALPQEEVSD